MTGVILRVIGARDRFGLKGPRATDWLAEQGIAFPGTANTWTVCAEASRAAAEGTGTAAGAAEGTGTAAGAAEGLLVARLGTSEFFLEDLAGGEKLRYIAPAAEFHPPGVFPVLRQDAAFSLEGDAAAEVLAQVCNVNFAALDLHARPVIMTLMAGVAVLVVPRDLDAQRQYLIWCDPTFGAYLEDSLGTVVTECGGRYRGVPV